MARYSLFVLKVPYPKQTNKEAQFYLSSKAFGLFHSCLVYIFFTKSTLQTTHVNVPVREAVVSLRLKVFFEGGGRARVPKNIEDVI